MKAAATARSIADPRLAAWLLVALLAGCSSGRPMFRTVADVSPEREARRQQISRSLEAQRIEAQLRAAHGCWDRGDTTGCRQALQAVLERQPENPDALRWLAELHFVGGRPAEARPLLERLALKHPGEAEVHYRLGLVLLALGEAESAQARFDEAARLEPENRLFAAAPPAAVPSREPDAAVPQTPPSTARLASSAQSVRAASSVFAAPSARASGSEDVAEAVAEAVQALEQNQPQRAVAVLEAARGSSPSAPLLRTLGMAYYRAGDYAMAEAALRESLRLDNSSGLSYFLLGCTFSKLGEPEAETCFRKAGELDPRYARPVAAR